MVEAHVPKTHFWNLNWSHYKLLSLNCLFQINSLNTPALLQQRYPCLSFIYTTSNYFVNRKWPFLPVPVPVPGPVDQPIWVPWSRRPWKPGKMTSPKLEINHVMSVSWGIVLLLFRGAKSECSILAGFFFLCHRLWGHSTLFQNPDYIRTSIFF